LKGVSGHNIPPCLVYSHGRHTGRCDSSWRAKALTVSTLKISGNTYTIYYGVSAVINITQEACVAVYGGGRVRFFLLVLYQSRPRCREKEMDNKSGRALGTTPSFCPSFVIICCQATRIAYLAAPAVSIAQQQHPCCTMRSPGPARPGLSPRPSLADVTSWH
jgi:hypothetical protein